MKKWQAKTLGWLAHGVAKCIAVTLRVRIVMHPDLVVHHPAVYAFWHADQFMPTVRFKRLGIRPTALVSASIDGDAMAAWLTASGYRCIRGSSSRRSVGALVALLRALRDGQPVAIAVDGPKGPAREAKSGAVALAQKTQSPLVPVASWASRCWTFSSWDRYRLPQPFARVVFVLGAPIQVAAEASVAQITQELTLRLNALEAEARSVCA